MRKHNGPDGTRIPEGLGVLLSVNRAVKGAGFAAYPDQVRGTLRPSDVRGRAR